MKWRKGICLILCILLLTGLAPARAAAVCGECVDGVWASIALTGGANKLIFSADDAVEQQILHPDEGTDARYIQPEGLAYDAASNTLSLTDFDAPTANLVLTMMGGDFRIRLTGSSRLGAICSESKGRGGSITFCGDGALTIVSADTAILVRAGGAPDFVRVEPQVKLSASSGSGSAIRVCDTSLSSGAIDFDTSDPQVTPYDECRALRDVTTSDARTVDICTLPGSEGLYGLEAVPKLDENGERIVYNVYLLGEQDAEGLYTAGEPIEREIEDASAYQIVYTPHDWKLVETGSGAYASRVRVARFTISARALDDNGTLSVSQTEVARGGSVEVNAVPKDGFKIAALTVNGTQVSAANGVYVIGGITADQTVTASFAEASAVRITVTAPARTAFEVPADGAEAFVSEPFAAIVADGADDPVGATVRWSIAPETEGVSIGPDGRVTVTNAAKSAAQEGLSFTVTAAAEGTELVDSSRSFTVALAARHAASMRLTRGGEILGESDTLPIPAAGETTVQQYGALVYDQYGALREERLIWSAGDWPLGVRRDDDTLTVWDNCRDGSSLVVTAVCADDSTVSASVTVGFAEQRKEATMPAAAAMLGAGPSRAAPAVSWPDVTLAEDPVYGITWAALVSLGDNGSATLDGNPLEGSFAINQDGAALPNLSDSYKIVFSYTEGEETKTIESDERSVTLGRKPLDASMITLSPAEMPYTGAPCEPAVSIRDGDRALISGTDFSVTGYANNTEIGTNAEVTIEGLGNYKDTVTKRFTITPIPGSSISSAVTPCKPEDAGTAPAIDLKYGDTALAEGTDYDLSLKYDIPTKTGTATISFKGKYSGTRVLSFDLPNYLITVGAGSSWSKNYTAVLAFKANGALGKFTELTVDGKTVPTSYYTVESGSTIVKIKPDYLRGLTAGKHIVGVAYKDGKALAIFSVIDVDRRGVPTGDGSNAPLWIAVMAASLIALGVLAFAFVRSGQKKKKKKASKKRQP